MIANKPQVSVVVPIFNHARYLRCRLESIFAQTFNDFEVILLDDRSTDESASILQEFRHHPKVTHFEINEQNSGSPFVQWNKGVSLAKGNLIWIAESDDDADAGLLGTMTRAITSDENVGISYCQSLKIDETGKVIGDWELHTKDLDDARWKGDFIADGRLEVDRYLLIKNTIPNVSAVIFKKDVFEKVGGADTSVEKCADWLLWMKMLLVSDLAFVAAPLNRFRSHAESVIATSQQHPSYYRCRMRQRFDETLREYDNDGSLFAIAESNRRLLVRDLGLLSNVSWSNGHFGRAAYYLGAAYLAKVRGN